MVHHARLLVALLWAPLAPAAAQVPRRAPSIATNPTSAGPATTAAPIGGLRTRPIATPLLGASGSHGEPYLLPSGVQPERPRWFRGELLPYRLADAPLARGGVVVGDRREGGAAGGAVMRGRAAWIPTAEKPQWVRDSTLRPVQGWRDLIVTDVVCNYAAQCRERRQTVRAKWVARCGCYAFGDGWNRIWRVE